MKCPFFLYFILLISLAACDNRREKAIQLKETELNQKEQELLLKENTLQLKEEELANRERLLDSTSNNNVPDTLAALHPTIPGIWNVTMRCTVTTCAGSAVGDTKKEQWHINFQNNTMIISAMNDNRLVRVYSGSYLGNSFELSAQQENALPAQAAKMIVRLQKTKENQMTGQREIIRPEDCRILYELELQKQ